MPLPKPAKPDLDWSVDRHRLWRRILADYEEVKKRCPDGFRPVVRVFLKSRPSSIELGFVRTTRDPEYPWLRFELTRGVRPGEEPGALPSDGQWIYAHEDDVERVEISLEELKEGFDFLDFGVLDENPEPGG
jgi:hypothetical protein